MSLEQAINDFRKVAAAKGEVWGPELGELSQYGCRAVEVLIGLLKDQDPNVRAAAADVLGQWKSNQAIVEPLIAALNDTESAVRMHAASSLGGTRDTRALKPLVALLTDEWHGVRWVVIQVISNIGTDEALVAIDSIMHNDTDERIRRYAAATLCDLAPDKVIAAWEEGLTIEPAHVASALAQTDPARAFDFIETTVNNFGDLNRLVQTLGKVNDPRFRQILESALNDDDWQIRSNAAAALAAHGFASGIDALIQMLDVPESRILAPAASRLGQYRSQKALEPLLRLMDSGDATKRLHAAGALGRLGDPRAIDPLVAALSDGIASAATALGSFDDVRSVKALIDALHNTTWSVRNNAITSLMRLKPPSAVEPLIELLQDESMSNQSEAAKALGVIGDRRAAEALSHSALYSESSYLRKFSAWALSRLETAEAEEALLEVFSNRDLDAINGACHFYIGKGIAGSEELIIQAFECNGHKGLAEDLANCGNLALADIGQQWLNTHPSAKYSDWPWLEPTGVRWGSLLL